MKHYLQVTDRQFSEAAGVAQGVAPAQVIGNQGISENSPTLKNKAFPVIDHHDLSQEMPEWAMRDSNLHAFESMKQGVFRIVKKQAGPKAGPNVSLSQVTSRLIERWDEMSEEEKLTVQVFIDWDVLVGDINTN